MGESCNQWGNYSILESGVIKVTVDVPIAILLPRTTFVYSVSATEMETSDTEHGREKKNIFSETGL